MDSIYRAIANAEDPAILFNKAIAYFFEIRQLSQAWAAEISETFEKYLTQQMANVVFGSNNIERVGLGLDETIRLCEAIFHDEDVHHQDIDDSIVP